MSVRVPNQTVNYITKPICYEYFIFYEKMSDLLQENIDDESQEVDNQGVNASLPEKQGNALAAQKKAN